MRNRGDKYWAWVDSKLHTRCHDQELANGTKIDVQVRLSPTGVIQVFIGVYAKSGMMLFEEYRDGCDAKTITQALLWGMGRARSLATGTATAGHWIAAANDEPDFDSE